MESNSTAFLIKIKLRQSLGRPSRSDFVQSKFVERFPELSLFYELSSPLDSEMICIFPYFCPYEESAREIRDFLFSRCLLLYQEVWRSSVLLFL